MWDQQFIPHADLEPKLGKKNRTGSRVNILKGCVNPKWPNTNLSERSAIILEYYLKCFSKYQILVKARRVPPSHSDANNCGLCFHLGTTIVVKAENLWRTRARARKQRGRGGLRGNGRRRRGKPSGKRSRKTQGVSVFPSRNLENMYVQRSVPVCLNLYQTELR